MQQINLKVFHMNCEGCTNTVRVTLEKYPGVKNVEAKILCDDGILPFDLIKHLENNTHYQALVNIDKK